MKTRSVGRSCAGIVVLLSIAGAAIQQGALAQLGLTDALARELALEAVQSGGTDARAMSARSYSRLVMQGRKSFQKLPAEQRALAASGLFVWAKAYAASPAFSAAYAKVRTEQKPMPRAYTLTIDQEIKKAADEQLAGQEQMKKAAAGMSAKEREQMLAIIKQSEERASTYLEAMRAQKVAERAREQEDTEQATKEWQETYPASPRAFVAKALRAFLEGTAGVDYSAKVGTIVGEGGESLGLENPSLRASKPWMWVEAILVGKEAVAAARAAAESWLKEIGN